MSDVPQVLERSFEKEVIQSGTPVLVDFYAEWCQPCKALAPVIDDIAREYQGRLKVVKVDIDEAQDTSTRYNITAVPTLIVFKGGQEALRRQGAAPKSAIVAELKALL